MQKDKENKAKSRPVTVIEQADLDEDLEKLINDMETPALDIATPPEGLGGVPLF